MLYGVEGKIWGIRGGYKGFYDETLPPIELNKRVVDDIHHMGGTVLGSSRGGFDIDKIIGFLKEKRIKQLYVIGGDGTHRGAVSTQSCDRGRLHDCFVSLYRYLIIIMYSLLSANNTVSYP